MFVTRNENIEKIQSQQRFF